jgi:hypothetical protein
LAGWPLRFAIVQFCSLRARTIFRLAGGLDVNPVEIVGIEPDEMAIPQIVRSNGQDFLCFLGNA